MAGDPRIGELLFSIAAQRDRAKHARLLARDVTDANAQASLRKYAEELDFGADKLEAELAVMKQQANDIEAESEPPIAALKPPADPQPET